MSNVHLQSFVLGQNLICLHTFSYFLRENNSKYDTFSWLDLQFVGPNVSETYFSHCINLARAKLCYFLVRQYIKKSLYFDIFYVPFCIIIFSLKNFCWTLMPKCSLLTFCNPLCVLKSVISPLGPSARWFWLYPLS